MKDKLWITQPIFITGAFGLLGTWLVKQLQKDGARTIICLERDTIASSFSGLTSQQLSSLTIVRADLCDYSSLIRIMNEYDIRSVFHLGAQTLVGPGKRSPLSTFHSNIEGTWNLLEACRLSPWVRRVIVASSDKAYGEKQELPYVEGDSLVGRFPYDVSKSCTDLIAQSYYYSYKLPVCITRCGNIFGGGDFHTSRIVPGTILSLLQNKAPIIRSDGTPVRDYIYVEDIVSAYITLASAMGDESLWGHAFNFSDEHPSSVLELVNEITKLMGKQKIKPCIENIMSNEIQNQYLSCQKAKQLLKWHATYGLEKGLKKTIKWYKQHMHKNFSIFDVASSKDNFDFAP